MTDVTRDDTLDTELRAALNEARVIGLVGASANPDRPSNGVGRYLVRQGYRVVGVNPGLAGKELFGEPVVARIADLPADTDLLDLFRRAEDVPVAVDEALAHLPRLRTIWMQLGIRHAGAAAAAREKGLRVVEDRCPAIEIPRLFPDGLPPRDA
jgi:predicted CoA-binding protein